MIHAPAIVDLEDQRAGMVGSVLQAADRLGSSDRHAAAISNPITITVSSMFLDANPPSIGNAHAGAAITTNYSAVAIKRNGSSRNPNDLAAANVRR